ncbi:hypothetical protein [Gordonia sp. MMO-8]|uniref:hypothetical protein n=1 Tax=Gordonia sp. MMO-8 TaxID=3127886 RepID=UPI0030159B5E
MPGLPDAEEIHAYAQAHSLQHMGRSAVIKHMLDAERRARIDARPLPMIDGDAVAAALKAMQDAADEAGVRPEVLAAAVPAVAARIVAQSITSKDTKR